MQSLLSQDTDCAGDAISVHYRPEHIFSQWMRQTSAFGKSSQMAESCGSYNAEHWTFAVARIFCPQRRHQSNKTSRLLAIFIFFTTFILFLDYAAVLIVATDTQNLVNIALQKVSPRKSAISCINYKLQKGPNVVSLMQPFTNISFTFHFF